MNLQRVGQNMAVYDAGATWEQWSLTLEIACAARSDMCVLLSGKADVARDIAYRIHNISGWRFGEFLVVDCADDTLVERVLATPAADYATAVRSGVPGVRLIQAGSVLLEEVGRLRAETQRRLASHLASARLEAPYRRSRWRLFASTSEPLPERVAAGEFSEVLFYRLNTIHLAVPGAPGRPADVLM